MIPKLHGYKFLLLSHLHQYMAIFLHIFIFFGVNIGLQLFVGIVVNNFNANKPGNTALLSVAQKRWTDLVLRISLLRPIKRPTPPGELRWRHWASPLSLLLPSLPCPYFLFFLLPSYCLPVSYPHFPTPSLACLSSFLTPLSVSLLLTLSSLSSSFPTRAQQIPSVPVQNCDPQTIQSFQYRHDSPPVFLLLSSSQLSSSTRTHARTHTHTHTNNDTFQQNTFGSYFVVQNVFIGVRINSPEIQKCANGM